jgi:preprotein translocase subunit SecD
MKHVQRRLKITDVGDVTVTIEQDIVDTLKEMIKALEKAKKDLDDKKNPPKPNDNPPPPPQDQKLIEKIAELKMIKSMQLRVNARTELYSRRINGEQANEPGIREELRELSGRQERIMEVANKMAKGENQ